MSWEINVNRQTRHEYVWIFLANIKLAIIQIKKGASKGCVELLRNFRCPHFNKNKKVNRKFTTLVVRK